MTKRTQELVSTAVACELQANGAPEIEVTPLMRQAGAEVLAELSGVISSEGLAERVYIAMAGVRPEDELDCP